MKAHLKDSLDHLKWTGTNQLPKLALYCHARGRQTHRTTQKNTERPTTPSALKEQLLGPNLKHTMMMMMIMGEVRCYTKRHWWSCVSIKQDYCSRPMLVETCRRCDSICFYNNNNNNNNNNYYYYYYYYTNMDKIKHVCAVKESNIAVKDLIVRYCCCCCCCWNNKDIQCSGTNNNVLRYDYLLHLCSFEQKIMRGVCSNTDSNKRT